MTQLLTFVFVLQDGDLGALQVDQITTVIVSET